MRKGFEKQFFLYILLLCSFELNCSTIQSRIQDQSILFNSYPLEVRDKIKEGKIEAGFTPEMVFIAKGKPSKIIQKQTDGLSQVNYWYYSQPSLMSDSGVTNDSLSSPFGFPTIGPDPVRTVGAVKRLVYLIVRFTEGYVVDWIEIPQ